MRSNEERFWAKVDKTGDCWLWMGALSRGYGSFHSDDRTKFAHRFAYELATGPIPEGLDIDHICRVKRCVRPDHLRPTTRSQNNQNHGGSQANSRSGIRGVSWHKGSKKWYVMASLNKKRYFGGQFDSLEEAARRAVELRNSLFTHNEIDHRRQR